MYSPLTQEGRGYVLRRVLRRGARYARKKLNVTIGTFFSSLVDTVVSEMGEAFPEITKRVDDLKQVLNEEESSFSKTLDRGEKLFSETMARTHAAGSNVISGADAWRLYDTYGFPIDLTRLMAAEAKMEVNEEEFEACQNQAKETSRGGKDKTKEEAIALDVHTIAQIEAKMIKPTDDTFKYANEDLSASVKLVFANNGFVESVSSSSQRFGVILDRTNFYAEQGGQMFDTGSLFSDGKFDFSVQDVQVFGGYVMHIGYLKYGTIGVSDAVTCSYDEVISANLAAKRSIAK